MLYKLDLSRYFRQVPLCLIDYSLIGMGWRGLLYFDKMMLMRLKADKCSGLHTQADELLVHQLPGQFWISRDGRNSLKQFAALGNLINQLGIQEAKNKAVPSCTKVEFLGSVVDSQNLELSVSLIQRRN